MSSIGSPATWPPPPGPSANASSSPTSSSKFGMPVYVQQSYPNFLFIYYYYFLKITVKYMHKCVQIPLSSAHEDLQPILSGKRRLIALNKKDLANTNIIHVLLLPTLSWSICILFDCISDIFKCLFSHKFLVFSEFLFFGTSNFDLIRTIHGS